MSLPVPHWAAELEAAGWANIHSIVPQPLRLSGVDAFLGDTNAHTLILGKDSAPARVFRRLVADGHPDPYRHDPTLPTNLMLQQVLGAVGIDASLDGSTASTCGVYYANAYWLLRDDDRFSGPLTNASEAFQQSRPVLEYMLSSLTRLERIIAMGADAYAALMSFYGMSEDWRANLQQRRHVVANGLKLCASSHLGYFGVRMRLRGSTRDQKRQAVIEDWKSAFGH
ncbi:MAG: hypothetical protein NW206_02105 [Hyphomonadaceae bacterium]|nr:hypothetical protein [Hyphomonadaceae bacterium]